MATYISLLNWTDEGIRTYKDTLERASAAGDLAQKMGGTLKDVYWTTGPSDTSIPVPGASAIAGAKRHCRCRTSKYPVLESGESLPSA